MRLFAAAVALIGLCMCSCSRFEGPSLDSPHATVWTKDGRKIQGVVTASTASEITLSGDDKQPHTISMKDVRRVEYEDAVTASATEGSARVADHPHPTQAAIKTKTYQLPAGTEISVRNEETIDSGKAVEGQIYAAEVTMDVTDAAGDVVVPRGSNAQIVIRSVTKGGKIKGASDLVLDLQSVSVEGQKFQLSTHDLEQRGRDGVGANKRTATFTGGGAAVGAVIGAIAGGGKGAAIGAGAGAGAGAATQILTKGSIKVPAETVLTFKLDKPLRVVKAQ
jgi:ribosome maturation factor RimP